jgi:uncharacterized protein (UPF0179 family)
MTGTYKSIDSNTYEVTKVKNKLMLRCLTCTTKSAPVEVSEKDLKSLIGFKTMEKL